MTGSRSTRSAPPGSSASTRRSPSKRLEAMAGGAVESGGMGERVDWRLATPLGLTYLAFFAAPFAILLGISFYADSEQTRQGLCSWRKFYGDAFYLKVIFDTLRLRVFPVAPPPLPPFP